MAYPAYPYQPQMSAYGQQTFQYPVQPQQNAERTFFCRAATAFEEVKACPVDFSGNPMVFLGPGLKSVWIKVFNPSTGGSEVLEYGRTIQIEAEPPKAPTIDEFIALKELVKKQGDMIESLRGRRRSREEADDAI